MMTCNNCGAVDIEPVELEHDGYMIDTCPECMEIDVLESVEYSDWLDDLEEDRYSEEDQPE